MFCEPIEIIAISYFRPNDFLVSINSIVENTTIPYNLTIIDNSNGYLDQYLKKFENKATIIKNKRNIGKGASFKKWYKKIIRNSKSEYIVSLDSDIKVKKYWLIDLIMESEKAHKKLGAIAPVLKTSENDNFEAQLKKKSITMHGGENGYRMMNKITDTLYYNINTAGSLFLINREFYEKIKGYPGDVLFGHDDGFICKKAKKLNRFIGFTSKVECIHLAIDNNIDYIKWKNNNLNNIKCRTGHFDLDGNYNNISE